MILSLSPSFGIGWQGFTRGGNVLAGGLLYTYSSGSTSTQATYTDHTGATANANPIVLGADGRPPNEIWILYNQAYRYVLTDALGNEIKSWDNIPQDKYSYNGSISFITGGANGIPYSGYVNSTLSGVDVSSFPSIVIGLGPSGSFTGGTGTYYTEVFTTQPSNSSPNATFTAAITIKNSDGTTATTYSGNVTVGLGANPGASTLSGTLTQPFVSGVATFNDLSLDQIGTGYTLVASAPNSGNAAGQSSTFNIATINYVSATSAFTANRTSAAFTGSSSTCATTTFSYFVKFASTSGSVIVKVGNAYLALSATASGNSILGTMYNNGETDGSIVTVTTANYTFPLNTWVCVLISWNSLAAWQVYVNDTAITFATSGTSQSTVDLTKNFGNRGSVAISNGCEGQYWFDQTAAMDFSQQSNRRKFVSATGHPANLGTSGQLPTGSSPLIYFPLTQASPLANSGTGGNYDSSTGSAGTCSTSP